MIQDSLSPKGDLCCCQESILCWRYIFSFVVSLEYGEHKTALIVLRAVFSVALTVRVLCTVQQKKDGIPFLFYVRASFHMREVGLCRTWERHFLGQWSCLYSILDARVLQGFKGALSYSIDYIRGRTDCAEALLPTEAAYLRPVSFLSCEMRFHRSLSIYYREIAFRCIGNACIDPLAQILKSRG